MHITTNCQLDTVREAMTRLGTQNLAVGRPAVE